MYLIQIMDFEGYWNTVAETTNIELARKESRRLSGIYSLQTVRVKRAR